MWIAARDDSGATAGTELGFFRELVKPVENAIDDCRNLSAFCTKLTGITQDQVATALPLADVIESFDRWLHERNLVTALEQGTAVLIAHGGWDLGDQLPRECARKGIALASYWNTHADLKVIFSLTCPDSRGQSLSAMLDYLKLSHQGRAHSGIDEYASRAAPFSLAFPRQCRRDQCGPSA